MTKLIYVVEVRGLVLAHLSRKVIEAHLKALASAQRQNKSKDESKEKEDSSSK